MQHLLSEKIIAQLKIYEALCSLVHCNPAPVTSSVNPLSGHSFISGMAYCFGVTLQAQKSGELPSMEHPQEQKLLKIRQLDLLDHVCTLLCNIWCPYIAHLT